MQRLRELSRLVEAVYNDIDHTYGKYQQDSGLQCRSGCGACCNNPHIEATELEMLPMALSLFDRGQAEVMLDKLAEYNGFSCVHFVRQSLDGNQGYCGEYAHRPGVCRMFGAAAVKAKQGLTLSVCKTIKQDVPQKYAAGLIAFGEGGVPVIPHDKERIRQLDFSLSQQELPLNKALSAALQRVLTAAWYSAEDAENQVA